MVYTFQPAGLHQALQRSIMAISPGRLGATTAWLMRRPLPPSRSVSSRVPIISALERMFILSFPADAGAEERTATAVSLSRKTQRRYSASE